ncbi:branched-chain amino acid ABC transporter permease [Bradyrhizobium sp. Ec3.3]|uniref:branched-chain amino acid ABC transporter permease n=1 Tax=Bradyrhizobium sp. Ec3.3 TaxID=189753 RepID=UPI000688394B|nr:branched-chain amino acid ABC transporter permease [Bradyrhizobium sp. Ec3.3]
MTDSGLVVARWTPTSVTFTVAGVGLLLALSFLPTVASPATLDRMTTLFIYVILAATWNALAGYGGLVSIGQQAFFGLGAYVTIRLSNAGVNVYTAVVVAPLIVALFSLPLSLPMLRLKTSEFAVGMWVVAELIHLLVNLDPLIQGETGISLIALNAYTVDQRNALTFWIALAAVAAVLAILFVLLRSATGAGLQAIRDNEEAANSVGVRVVTVKRIVFVFAAAGAAIAGSLWLATAISFQPKTYFSAQWTSYMIFMVLVGGLGTFEGAIIGAVIFYAIEAAFGSMGVWYMIGLGAVALLFSLFLPSGLYGIFGARTGVQLLPVGYWLRDTKSEPAVGQGKAAEA